MERVVKSAFGYGKEKDNKSATHVILTIDEYNALQSNLRRSKVEIDEIIKTANQEIKKVQDNANKNIEDIDKQAQERIESILSDLNKANDEIHRLNDLNANLLRISKERANQKRGLKPKKVHKGYVVLDSTEYKYQYRIKKRQGFEVLQLPCWKVRMQSPYDSSISFDTIEPNLKHDLFKVFGASLGINSVFDDLEGESKDKIDELWSSDKNFIFQTKYKQNVKSGFWEVEYLVKASIVIPEDMRNL